MEEEHCCAVTDVTDATGAQSWLLSKDMCGDRYIPQEVLKDDFSALDRADVFMLGASLYELALGTHLPSGAALELYIR